MEYTQIDNENKYNLRCSYNKCNTKIISLGLDHPHFTVTNGPSMIKPQETSGDSNVFFKVDDVWNFDNIAVSKPLPDLSTPVIDSAPFKIERLLICSECSRGPIGFAGHESEDTHVNKLVYYLSSSSVLYHPIQLTKPVEA